MSPSNRRKHSSPEQRLDATRKELNSGQRETTSRAVPFHPSSHGIVPVIAQRRANSPRKGRRVTNKVGVPKYPPSGQRWPRHPRPHTLPGGNLFTEPHLHAAPRPLEIPRPVGVNRPYCRLTIQFSTAKDQYAGRHVRGQGPISPHAPCETKPAHRIWSYGPPAAGADAACLALRKCRWLA